MSTSKSESSDGCILMLMLFVGMLVIALLAIAHQISGSTVANGINHHCKDEAKLETVSFVSGTSELVYACDDIAVRLHTDDITIQEVVLGMDGGQKDLGVVYKSDLEIIQIYTYDYLGSVVVLWSSEED